MRGWEQMNVEPPHPTGLERWSVDVRRAEKPWGYELIWALTHAYCGKVLFVKAGHSLPLQFHRLKDEAWLVQSGSAKLELGDVRDSKLQEQIVGAGAAFRYVPGTVHRLTAVEDTSIIEVSTPHLDDVVRLDDAYGREGTSSPKRSSPSMTSWSNAGTRWSAELVDYALNRFHRRHLRIPTVRELRAGVEGLPSHSTIRKMYGCPSRMYERHGYRHTSAWRATRPSVDASAGRPWKVCSER